MDSKEGFYDIEIIEECRKEIKDIYRYISETLYEENAAKRLMKKLKNKIMNLAFYPQIYVKVSKKGDFEFRKITIDKYIVLYTIDEHKKIVYISHIYYGGRKY